MQSFYSDRSVLPDMRFSVNWFEVKEIENVNFGFAEFRGSCNFIYFGLIGLICNGQW